LVEILRHTGILDLTHGDLKKLARLCVLLPSGRCTRQKKKVVYAS
jgi:hypothetical protein